MNEPSDRLQAARRKAGFSTASEAARYFGWNENTYRSHENGERGLTLQTAIRYARSYRTTYQHLLTGSVAPEAQPIVYLKGAIRSKGRVQIYDPKSSSLDIVLPFDLPLDPYAYLIDTDAMFPRYAQGDIVMMWGDENWLEKSAQAEGVVWLDNGECFFGVATLQGEVASLEVVGAKPRRNLEIARFEVVRFVIRDTLYTVRVTRPLLGKADPADDDP